MYKLVTLVVAAFAFCDTANVAKRDEQCTGLLQCASYLSDLETPIFVSIPDEELYEQLCRKNNDLQTCFDDNKDDCEDNTFLTMVMREAQALNFICSAEGKEGLDSISDSPCVNDQTALLSAQEGMGECGQNVELELQLATSTAISNDEGMESVNVCSYLNQLKTCILESLKNHCGQNFGNFAKRLVDIYCQPFADQIGCGQQARQIRTLKSRLVPLIISGVRRRR
ncbi:uncharacterized protein LOC106052725 isoform X2 [Biomphalaria glabrata]|uniref:Uncharacterized protein LOC106052725 isoform X2 n=1 Tax=Biomphalaria glabrata TaxID=6526 RepID=A0A9W3BEW3_BIOGL|nr:uncharacterized protein LOC106052725 isoform X2 [Biomphalaria glabrata]